MTSLAKLPQEERPRERLFAQGAEALSLMELLALCLGSSGRQGSSVLDLASELLAAFGGWAELKEATLEELTAIKGIGKAKAAQVQAIAAINKKAMRTVGGPKYAIEGPDDVYTLVKNYFLRKKKEVVRVVFRDARGFAFSDELLAVGVLSEVLIHPREVFHRAFRRCAASFILVHNHPSGNAEPSDQDIALTKMLSASGQLMGLPIDDHIIIGQGTYVSLWERDTFSERAKY